MTAVLVWKLPRPVSGVTSNFGIPVENNWKAGPPPLTRLFAKLSVVLLHFNMPHYALHWAYVSALLYTVWLFRGVDCCSEPWFRGWELGIDKPGNVFFISSFFFPVLPHWLLCGLWPNQIQL